MRKGAVILIENDRRKFVIQNYNGIMSQSIPSKTEEAVEALSEDDRDWLSDRLVEYRELLEYLQAN
jgi:hypothetical protein